MYELPTSILIDGKNHPIRNNGDFRVILDCFSALDDYELAEQFRYYTSLIIFYSELNEISDVEKIFKSNVNTAIEEMFKFFNCGQQNIGMTSPHKLIDWNYDTQMICGAINNVANKEIRLEPYIHWWTFMGYYCSVGESTLATVVNIRNKIVKGKKLEKYEQEFKRENPHYFNWRSRDVSQIENDKLALSIWNKS